MRWSAVGATSEATRTAELPKSQRVRLSQGAAALLAAFANLRLGPDELRKHR